MRSMLDFGIKYSKDNQMQVKSEFKAYTPQNHFVIQFYVIITQNEKVELDLLEHLLTEQNDEEKKYEELNFDKLITQRYDSLYKHIKEFGYGMLIFPSIVKQLNGHYFIQKDNISVDQGSNNANISNNLATDKVKIGFRVPFEQAGMDSIVATHAYKINFAKKEVIDGRIQVYKTPQLKSKGRPFNKAATNKMQNIMMIQGLSQMSKQSESLQIINNIPMEGGENNSVLEPEQNGELNQFSRIQERQRTPQVQEYMSQKIFKNNIRQGSQASNGDRNSEEQRKNLIMLNTEINDEAEKSKRSKEESKHEEDKKESEGGIVQSGTNLTSGFPNDQKSGISKISQEQIEQIQPKAEEGGAQNKLKEKPKRINGQFLQLARENGEGLKFFGDNQNENQAKMCQENGNDGLKAMPTANFVPKNGKIKFNNHDQNSGSGSNVQSSGVINADSNGNIVVNSFLEEIKDQKTDSAVNSEFKNQFSFMELEKKNSKKRSRNNVSINDNENTKKFDSMDQQQIPINQMPFERNNEIRESHEQLLNSGESRGITIPQSADVSAALIPDLPPLSRDKSDDRNQDENDSEGKDVVKSLDDQIRNRANGFDQSIRSSSDYPYNFQMEKYDSFMMSSEASRQAILNSQTEQLQIPKKSMLLSKKLHREVSRTLYEMPVHASKQLMNPQDGQHSLRENNSQSQHGQSQVQNSQNQQQVDENQQQLDGQAAPETSVDRLAVSEELKVAEVAIDDGIDIQFASNTQNEKKVEISKGLQNASESISGKPSSENKSVIEQINGSAHDSNERKLNQQRQREPEEEKVRIEDPLETKRRYLFMEAYTDYESNNYLHQAIYMHCGEENLNQKMGFAQFQKSCDQEQNICNDLHMVNLTAKLYSEVIDEREKKLGNQTQVKEWQMNTSMFPIDLNQFYDVSDRSGQLRNLQAALEQEIELDDHWRNRNKNPEARSQSLSPNDKDQGSRTVQGNSNKFIFRGNTQINDGSHFDRDSQSHHYGVQEDHKMVVLVAEDNEMIQEAMQMMLQDNNVQFEACWNGNQAVEKFEEYMKAGKMFDVILMDLYMPQKDGFQASTEIRQLEVDYKVSKKDRHFICAVSSEVNLVIERRCFDSGMDDVVAKPLPLNTLLTLLNDHNRRRIYSSQLNSQQPHLSSNQLNVSPIQDGRQAVAMGNIQADDENGVNGPGYSTAQNPNFETGLI